MTFDRLYFLITEDLESRITFLLTKYKNQTEENIKQLALADPSPTNKYIDWIVKNSDQFRIPEDLNKIKASLQKFTDQSKTKKWQGSKDLNTYKSYKELVQQIEANADITNIEPVQQSQTPTDKRIKIKEENGITIYKVTDAETIMEIAANTEWCVRDEPYASDYLKKGPYFVIYKEAHTYIEYEYPVRSIKHNVPYVLIHFPTGQIKDKYDSEIDSETAEEIYPLIRNSFKNVKFNYNEGIGDFHVFLKKQNNKGTTTTIAQGSDKEILEKYDEPQRAYDTLTRQKIRDIHPLERRKLKESVSKSSSLTFMWLYNIHSLHTNDRDMYMERKLLEHNDETNIKYYATYLIDVANSQPYHIPQKKLVSVLKAYGAPFASKGYKKELYEFFTARNISLDDILLAPLKNKSLETLYDIRNYTHTLANTNTIKNAVAEWGNYNTTNIR